MKKIVTLLILYTSFLFFYSCNSSNNSNNPIAPNSSTVTYESKTYNTVQIGTQLWLKENLDVGTLLHDNQNSSNNNVIEKYCYNDDPANCTKYGALYRWDEAMKYQLTPGTQGICPPGWHIPTLTEYESLKVSVNNDGNSLKAIGQGSDAGTGTNISGFSALLAGFRDSGGSFDDLNYDAVFFTSSEFNSINAFNMRMGKASSLIKMENSYFNNNKLYSFSIRCVKD